MKPSPTLYIASFLISIQVRYNEEGEIEQSFSFNNNLKGIKSLFDVRYEAYNTFERMLKRKALKEQQLRFLKRLDFPNKVVLLYDKNGEYEPPNGSTFFTINTKIPPNLSCEFCSFKEVVDNFNFKCTLKSKVMNKEVKNCSVFKQRKDL